MIFLTFHFEMKKLLHLFIILSFFTACRQKNNITLFQLMGHTGIDFENTVTDGKIENGFTFRNFYNGGGVAIGDVNNDGLADVFLTSNMGENKLYLNKGDFKFEDITAHSGMKQDSEWCTGAVMADIDHDGWLDIYVCSSGHMKSGNRKNKLYINNHDLTFTEEAAKYGLDFTAYATQASFFDYDLDGDLDCFVIDNSPIPINTLSYANNRELPAEDWPVEDFLKGGGDHLYRNDHGHFTEVTRQTGIHGSLISFGLGASVGDINEDGYPDIFISNDSYERDYLYINQKDGTFKDKLEQWIQHTSFSSMGADIADINNDGHLEIFTTDMLPETDYRLKTMGNFDDIDLYRSKQKAGFYRQFMKNCLQLNNGNGTFSEIANYCGVSATNWSWGALMFDADNNGYNDIYVCNGVNRDVTNRDFMDFFSNVVIQKMVLTGKKESVDEVLKKIPRNPQLNKMYKNMGNLQFKDVGKNWGFTQPSFSNGAAYGDLDNDGDLDLVINNENQKAFVYKNNAREINNNDYLSILLKGRGKNTFAVGSKIKVYQNGQILSREVIPSRGFQSSVAYKQIIGLGNSHQVDSMIIIWPDRTYSKYTHPAIDTMLVIHKSEETKLYGDTLIQTISSNALLTKVKNNFDKATEDQFTDFYHEPCIPEMLSRQGPKCTIGDVNKDGLQDVYIGGAAGQPGQLYLQTSSGHFIKKEEKVFDRFKDFEDVAVLFFDADRDKDLDLFVGSGGNNHIAGSRALQDRLYKNDGQGNFTLDAAAFPNNGMNTAVACAYDFDQDGDLDLFVGSRSFPKIYGYDPESYLYVNDGKGHFTDIAKTKNPDIAHIGMVTGATWADITDDGKKDLVIAGEWMSPHVFTYKGNGHFKEVKTNLMDKYGWWYSLATADINGDDKTDLILGNIGENFYLQPDSLHPVKLWISDFDRNSSVDKILTYTINGRDKPVFLKNSLEEEFPSLKKENLSYADYAKKSIQDLFSPERIKNCIVKKFNYPSSCVAINKGNGQFIVEKLPVRVQLSSVKAILSVDIDQNGITDLILGGNSFGFLPQFDRLDGSFGSVLLNDGKGHFTYKKNSESGLDLEGEIRDIGEIKGKNGQRLLILRNNDYPVTLKLDSKLVLPIAMNQP